ncbi:MAG: NAD(P)-dependent oxidoreductase [Patescibacteria group bacterium]
MQKIIITGSKGIIGTILTQGLQESYEITGLDLPEADLTEIQTLIKVAEGKSAIIHLAWDTHAGDNINLQNHRMFKNVYQAALDFNIPRVIIASSVHADGFLSHDESRLLSPNEAPTPNSTYGVNKIAMETMGEYFAAQGLEVVCIRFGGVSHNNEPRQGEKEGLVFLDQRDTVSLIKAILSAEVIPNNFIVLYAVSDNAGIIHDISNPFGWVPKYGLR